MLWRHVRGWCEVSVPAAPGGGRTAAGDQCPNIWDLRSGSGHTLGSDWWDVRSVQTALVGSGTQSWQMYAPSSENEYCAHWYTLMSKLERSTLPTAGHWHCSWWQHSGHKSLPGYKAPPDTPQLRASLPPILSHNSPWWPPVVPRPGPGGHTAAAHPCNALLTDV